MTTTEPERDRPEGGALVVSLDFELAWGVHDSLGSDGSYRSHLMGARTVVPRLLELFARYGVAATWATVGLLFARSRDEREAFAPPPDGRPRYENPVRDAYAVKVGEGERDDPLHYAPSLIREIAATPRQEVASHTFSHYYCLEPGQTVRTFEADLHSATTIAEAGGYRLRSLVVPRHQVRDDYLPAVARAGFAVHRTNEANALSRPRAAGSESLALRGLRLADAYLPLTGANAVPWRDTRPDEHGLVDVRESRFLRPASARLAPLEPLRFVRIARAMEFAARRGRLFHLWWHPHNFGAYPDENLKILERLLDRYLRLRDRYGFGSESMAGIASAVRAKAADGTSEPSGERPGERQRERPSGVPGERSGAPVRGSTGA